MDDPYTMPTAAQPSGAGEKGQQARQQVTQQAQTKAQEAKAKAQDRIKQQLDDRSTQAGEQVQTLAQAVRKAGEEFSNQGNDRGSHFAEQAAGKLEGFGGYLTSADGDQLLSDLEEFARQKPWLVAAGAGVLGVIAARFLKASGEQAQQSS